MIIPNQLRNPDFRFAIARENSKLPGEKQWNSTNNYPFFSSKLKYALNEGRNYIVCTGFGQLIVVDFDEVSYYQKVHRLLPETFTVSSATKKMAHMYYILKGEMFKKVGIDYVKCAACKKEGIYSNVTTKCPICGRKEFTLIEGSISKRLCDLQAEGAGVVGPGSSIDRQFYDIVRNIPIAEISVEELKKVFVFEAVKKKEYKGEIAKPQPARVKLAEEILRVLKIEKTSETHYRCPFHQSESKKNLFINETGALHCFHCSSHWRNAFEFAKDVCKLRKDKETMFLINSIEMFPEV